MDEEKRKAYIAASFGSSPKKRCEDADRINAARPVVDEKYLTKLEKSGISVVTREDFQYPHSFLDLYEPPVLFYAKGDLALLETTCVTVVGTRRATRYGVEATEYFAKGLAEAGVTIVSGLASGIDAIAHKAALSKRWGKTDFCSRNIRSERRRSRSGSPNATAFSPRSRREFSSRKRAWAAER